MKALLASIITFSFVFLHSSSSAIASENDLLIQNITIISSASDSSQASKPIDVYVDKTRIKAIGENLQIDASKTIDGTGLFLTAGLIDSHTHLRGVPGMAYAQEQANPKIARLAKKQIPLSYLYHGFTTVIDLHSDAKSIAEWNQHSIGPMAYFCGGAPIVDGYPMSFIPKPIRYQITPYFLMEGESTMPRIDDQRHTPKAVISRMKSDGAICVKTHFETGFGRNKNLPTPTIELISELKNQAEKNGLKLLLHANSERSYRFGVAAGVDAFVHGAWHWNDKTRRTPDEPLAALLDSAIAKGVKLQPTVQVLYGERDLHQPNYLQQTALKRVLPKVLIDWYASEEGQSFRRQMSRTPYVRTLLKNGHWQQINAEPIARVNSVIRHWTTNNGALLFGSDTPSDMTYANPPGLNGRFEMSRWQALDVTPTQFLAAATIDNARFFNLDKEIGSIELGKRADMLILSDDPRETIDAFDSIKWVVSKGKAIERSTLSALNDH